MRTILFIISFWIGLAAIGLALLAPEIRNYYKSKAKLTQIQANNEQLAEQLGRFDEMLGTLKDDPNLINRVGRVTLGIEVNDANNAAILKLPETEMKAAEQILSDSNISAEDFELPGWLLRVNSYENRKTLFISGSCLIVIACVFFGYTGPRKNEHQNNAQ